MHVNDVGDILFRIQITGLLAGLLVLLLAQLAVNRVDAPLFVYNTTVSVPEGLYRRASPNSPYVAVRLPERLRWLAARGYVAPDAYLLKRIAARAGDTICVRPDGLWVGANAYPTRAQDGVGRRLPRLSLGCQTLRDGELILVAEHPRSLDSRYFGPLSTNDVAFHVEPVWTF